MRTVSPELSLQTSVFSYLNQTDLNAIVSNRIYDTVPAKPVYPFLYYGEDIITFEPDQGGDPDRCVVRVYGYSVSKNKQEIKQLGSLIRFKLDRQIEVEGFDTGEFEYVQTIYSTTQTDSGPVHSVMVEFSYLLFEQQP